MDEGPSLDCPLCGEKFNDPKILPCNHTICGKCVSSWLRNAGQSGLCPYCRTPMFAQPPSSSGDAVQALVDALPTDLTIVAKVKIHDTLSTDPVCMRCKTTTPATIFCLQCNMKLCPACLEGHNAFPSLKSHEVKRLDSLTAADVINQSACKTHSEMPAELYCSFHGELVCMQCAATSHRSFECVVKGIAKAAQEQREKLKQVALSLTDKEKSLRTQIKRRKDKLTDMRSRAQMAFDSLYQCVETRRLEVEHQIQAQDQRMVLTPHDQLRAALFSQVGALEKLLDSGSDAALLEMEKTMMSKVTHLQQEAASLGEMQEPADLKFDAQELAQLESGIAKLGHDVDVLRIVLLGSAGSGKSSLGNTLLGKIPHRRSFRHTAGNSSEGFGVSTGIKSRGMHCDWHTAIRFGTTLEVTDTPGLDSNTRMDEGAIREEIIKGIALVNPGPNVVVFNTRYGRFTEEHYQAFSVIKELFAEDFSKYLIVVFNAIDGYGDEESIDEQRQVLHGAISEIGGELGEVIRQAGGRYMCVNNRATLAERERQACDLIQMMQDLVKRNGRQAYLKTILTQQIQQKLDEMIRQEVARRGISREQTTTLVKKIIVEEKISPNLLTAARDDICPLFCREQALCLIM